MNIDPEAINILLSVLFILSIFTLFVLCVVEAIQASQFTKSKRIFFYDATWFLSPKKFPGGERHCKNAFICTILMAALFGLLYLR